MARVSKMTLPLAMNVSTELRRIASNSSRNRAIRTVRPPTLIARRKAKYLAKSALPNDFVRHRHCGVVHRPESRCAAAPGHAWNR